jgi:cytochrome P450
VSRLPSASPVEAGKVVATGLLPSLARGLFSPRRGTMKRLTALNADRRTVAVLSALKRKHGGEGVRLLGGRMVLVWGEESLREVLDRSADVYAADAGAKAKGMSHFQPDALTLSRGEEWKDRRRFTEAVLATGERHPDATRMEAVVADEVQRLEVDSTLGWDEWERLFDRITLRIIFGDGHREDTELTQLLEDLMAEANRIAGLSRSDKYYDLYGRLERTLIDPEPGSLVARIADAPHTETTRVVQQLPHWMFAMRDTLGANCFRALAAVVAHPGEHDLEACLQEAMRLWPTTPLLARETTRETELAGEQLKEGTQVMIVNVFNHRDPDAVPDADRFVPERWADGARDDYRFNQLSHGTQDCPGGGLVSLIGTAVLERALERWRLRLLEPAMASAGGDQPYMVDFYSIRFEVTA